MSETAFVYWQHRLYKYAELEPLSICRQPLETCATLRKLRKSQMHRVASIVPTIVQVVRRYSSSLQCNFQGCSTASLSQILNIHSLHYRRVPYEICRKFFRARISLAMAQPRRTMSLGPMSKPSPRFGVIGWKACHRVCIASSCIIDSVAPNRNL